MLNSERLNTNLEDSLNWEFIRIWLKQNLHIRTLYRDGKTVFYVHPVGGEYRELKPFETP
jgi:hypothetical protein